MSSVPWKKFCLVASVLCFVVGSLGVEITHNRRLTVLEKMNLPRETRTEGILELGDRLGALNSIYEFLYYVGVCSPLFAYLFIFLNRRKPPTSHNRLS